MPIWEQRHRVAALGSHDAVRGSWRRAPKLGGGPRTDGRGGARASHDLGRELMPRALTGGGDVDDAHEVRAAGGIGGDRDQ